MQLGLPNARVRMSGSVHVSNFTPLPVRDETESEDPDHMRYAAAARLICQVARKLETERSHI